jgi:hypothetical protein
MSAATVKSEPDVHEPSYDCAVCWLSVLEDLRSGTRVMTCSQCPAQNKLCEACYLHPLSNKSCGQCAGPLREYQHRLSSKSSADIIDVDAISAAPEDLLGHAAPAAATVLKSVRAEETVLPQAPSAKRSRRETSATAEAPIMDVREKMRDDELPHVAVEESAEIVELKKALGAAKAEAHKAEALQKQLDGLKQALRDQHGEHTRALNQSKDEAAKVLQHARDEAMRAHAEQQRAFEKAAKVLQLARDEAMRAHAEQQRAFEKERDRLALSLPPDPSLAVCTRPGCRCANGLIHRAQTSAAHTQNGSDGALHLLKELATRLKCGHWGQHENDALMRLPPDHARWFLLTYAPAHGMPMHVPATASVMQLVEQLRSGTAATKADAARQLGSMASQSETERRGIVAAGAIGPLVALLQLGDDTGKASSANALGYLAVDGAHRGSIVAADAIGPLVALLQHGDDTGKARARLALDRLNALPPT